MPRRFGEIEGYPPGSWFPDRHTLAASGVHTPLQAGISGDKEFGAESIVLSGGYEDDEDYGDYIIYTGQGGNEAGRQVSPQVLVRGNLALARSRVLGRPVRVIRGARHGFKQIPELQVPTGYRYDGLYHVEGHWRSRGKSGLPIWRFSLVRIAPDVALQRAGPATLPIVAELGPLYDSEASGEAVPRQTTLVQRIVRNTAVAISMKALYSARCQVCLTTISTAAGDYSEAAHIRPLGMPHNGPDHPSNVLCLCPNHHVMFDLGGFVIRDDLELMNPQTGELIGSLYVHPKHQIELDHVRYHRAMFSDDVVVPFEQGPRSFRRKKSGGSGSGQERMFR